MSPVCDILNYTLMPNHFHFLIHANKVTETIINRGLVPCSVLSEAIRILLSSYTKTVNHEHNKTGNLFQQNTKSKCVTSNNYSSTCFHYIHQNAWKAGLVERMEDWQYCSFLDFEGNRKKSLCNIPLAYELLDLSYNNFYQDSYGVIEANTVSFLY